jgi:hypothetical protein
LPERIVSGTFTSVVDLFTGDSGAFGGDALVQPAGILFFQSKEAIVFLEADIFFRV